MKHCCRTCSACSLNEASSSANSSSAALKCLATDQKQLGRVYLSRRNILQARLSKTFDLPHSSLESSSPEITRRILSSNIERKMKFRRNIYRRAMWAPCRTRRCLALSICHSRHNLLLLP
ncbi:hypothetical protein Ciccas_013521 [Cichlidogyrus casuarinus]|uniref:Uncharacterized protein n=1 Tax=Cichlidogyrus casuarinus TaxID=1844966 RepID=A0ABD2PLV1_9PLAT